MEDENLKVREVINNLNDFEDISDMKVEYAAIVIGYKSGELLNFVAKQYKTLNGAFEVLNNNTLNRLQGKIYIDLVEEIEKEIANAETEGQKKGLRRLLSYVKMEIFGNNHALVYDYD